jgi:hypothetical protein
MNPRGSFFRKIAYLLAIGLLLIVMYALGRPATPARKGAPPNPGGLLTRLRADYGLSETQFGEVDPTSVTIKLAFLGLRGIAADILWEKANAYKMKKDWGNLAATLNQIMKIQPHYVSVWNNQAWNLSYNVSTQFDGYRDRYRWVIKGINFLQKGIRCNDRQPSLVWYLGWIISEKIGKADEVKQYRRLFKADDDFHGARPVALRDNWLVGKEEFERAVAMVENFRGSMMNKSPLIYRANAPMCQMSYAEALEKDGTFGEVARGAWKTAGDEWRRYGNEDILTSFRNDRTGEPIVIHLNDQEKQEEEAKKLIAKLDAFQPGLREKIVAEKRAALSPREREALDAPPDRRTGKQGELAAKAEEAVQVTHNEVARRLTGPKRKEAIELAKAIVEHEQMVGYIHQNRQTINFEFWRRCAQTEQEWQTVNARELLYRGDQKYLEGSLVEARDTYRAGLKAWRAVLDAHKDLAADRTTGEDLMETIGRYRRILRQLNEPFPKPFILQDIIDAQQPPNPMPKPQKEEKEEKAKGKEKGKEKTGK